ncbi:MAG TPA: hypothetical protein VF696_01860 [Candidatus Paceibacterota bacterium]
MAYRTDNRHSTRFLARKFLRRLRYSLDHLIEELFVEKRRHLA